MIGRGTGHPGLAVAERVSLRRWRRLPVPGEVTVAVADTVSPTTVVARAERARELVPVNVARSLDIPAHEVPRALLKKCGDRVTRGEEIARTAGFFGLLRSRCHCPVTGRLASVSERTGQILVEGEADPIEVTALIAGVVKDVEPERGVLVEGVGALVQGVLGVGGEGFGPLVPVVGRPSANLTAAMVADELRGAVIIGGARCDAAALRRAAEVGVAAVITGGIEDEELTAFLGDELTVAQTGDEAVAPTLVITGGIGPVPMERSTFALLTAHAGELAAVTGRTRVRAGAVRPEILVTEKPSPVPGAPSPLAVGADPASDAGRAILAVGRRVRLVGADDLGTAGTVVGLPSGRKRFSDGGLHTPVEVRLEAGTRVTIPRPNVELI